jgi:hypothetical protein
MDASPRFAPEAYHNVKGKVKDPEDQNMPGSIAA